MGNHAPLIFPRNDLVAELVFIVHACEDHVLNCVLIDRPVLSFVLTQEKETAIEFAQRVKADICRRGGLVDLPW